MLDWSEWNAPPDFLRPVWNSFKEVLPALSLDTGETPSHVDHRTGGVDAVNLPLGGLAAFASGLLTGIKRVGGYASVPPSPSKLARSISTQRQKGSMIAVEVDWGFDAAFQPFYYGAKHLILGETTKERGIVVPIEGGIVDGYKFKIMDGHDMAWAGRNATGHSHQASNLWHQFSYLVTRHGRRLSSTTASETREAMIGSIFRFIMDGTLTVPFCIGEQADCDAKNTELSIFGTASGALTNDGTIVVSATADTVTFGALVLTSLGSASKETLFDLAKITTTRNTLNFTIGDNFVELKVRSSLKAAAVASDPVVCTNVALCFVDQLSTSVVESLSVITTLTVFESGQYTAELALATPAIVLDENAAFEVRCDWRNSRTCSPSYLSSPFSLSLSLSVFSLPRARARAGHSRRWG